MHVCSADIRMFDCLALLHNPRKLQSDYQQIAMLLAMSLLYKVGVQHMYVCVRICAIYHIIGT